MFTCVGRPPASSLAPISLRMQICRSRNGAYIYMPLLPLLHVAGWLRRRPVCLTRHILRLALPPPLPAFPLPPPSPRSARLARTCMSVDSVLCCSLPWHAPTSLQCSSVCINWQRERDSGYVVCGAGWEERERKEERKKEGGGREGGGSGGGG